MLIIGIADRDNLPFYAILKNGDIMHSANYLPEGLPLDEINSIAYFQKPFLKLERVLETYLSYAPKGLTAFKSDFPRVLKETFTKKRDLVRALKPFAQTLSDKDIAQKLLFSDQAFSLCAEAFYPSPYEEAAVLCLDDMGEWASTSIALGQGSSLTIEKEILYPHSLGFFIDAFAGHLGLSREKFTALAKTGEPAYARMLSRKAIDIKNDGSFILNQFYFSKTAALQELLVEMPNAANIAASVMDVTAQISSLMVHAIARDYRGIHNLCVTGEIAHEPIIRERIMRDHPFDHVDISQNRGNSALARGAALAAYYMHHKAPRDIMFLQNLPTAVKK